MNILVLSCSTGGGHDSVGNAIGTELKARGHDIKIKDVYGITAKRFGGLLNNTYIKIARHAPWLFGKIYSLGAKISRSSLDSPIYAINKRFARRLEEFLAENHFDAIVCSHMFPAHILRAVSENGYSVPKTFLVATDYTCHPFMEDAYYDAMIIPHSDLIGEFISCGINADKIKPIGIPVRSNFNVKNEAKDKFELVISSGSMGAGGMKKAVKTAADFCCKHGGHITVICGSNKQLFRKLLKKYGKYDFATIIGYTDKMAEYIASATAFITKPGGISSTEAGVTNTPLIHISPIPGCETINAEYFSKRRMSINAGRSKKKLNEALEYIFETENRERMAIAQSLYINKNANTEICDYIIGEVNHEKG